MLTVYENLGDHLGVVPAEAQARAAGPHAWYDLNAPTPAEVGLVEAQVGLSIPSRDEMEEIEPSARLYVEDGAEYLTVTAGVNLGGDDPDRTPITFILKGATLVSVRHADIRPFKAFAARSQKTRYDSAGAIMLGLVEAMIDRMADSLEASNSEIDQISRSVFQKRATRINLQTEQLRAMIERIGRVGDILSLLREALVSVSRLLSFHQVSEASGPVNGKAAKARMRSLGRDVDSLRDHAGAQAAKVNFLLDATLGLINLEQNQIIKIFSVAAVVFLPPTLVASIYGMNFTHMPELGWTLGYPWAIGLMVLSAALPFLYFKRRGWL